MQSCWSLFNYLSRVKPRFDTSDNRGTFTSQRFQLEFESGTRLIVKTDLEIHWRYLTQIVVFKRTH